ncbi:unnamed protein product [Rotaria sp. Silwood1]|nr:unnamed protein product [Rotaria sp. Silwood1]CAF0842706.1 unnamed protein product [Rotaria sp. Silwood1]CAF3368850.1 unnamed protein product [Rotaria sp. Silwood1]CAF4498695.1 unnamed protein product [Rotaria sp. Silwood1]CAF4590351.1 unnamed protein product [Rotaria sp. Silwood1]
MCTFNGILKEYPWISIDSFLQTNCHLSQVFFISHIHTDHLRGLDEPTFAQYITNNRSIRIYCSEASRHFLSILPAYKHLSQFYSVVNVDQPFTIENPMDKNISITVTCFGSGHCPGSLMLLFEGCHGTVLYTGDFRLYSHQSNRHRIISSKKLIDALYIDMTFFEPSIRQLPEREQACQKLIHFIEQYDYRYFYLKTSARVGYEYIYTSLYQHFKILIHVNSEQYHLYDCLPQVQQALTIDGNRTRLHACWPQCAHAKSSITIVLSVLWFTLQQQQQFNSPLIQIATDYYRLCYSLHSSYTEICKFVKQISPIRIHPIALPTHITPERFNGLLKQLGIQQFPTIYFSPSNVEQQIKRRYHTIENINSSDNDDELDFDCHQNRLNNEKQLFKRISNLQQPPTKKLKTKVDPSMSTTHEQYLNNVDLVVVGRSSSLKSQ